MNKRTQLFGPNRPKFGMLGEIFDEILLQSLKAKYIDLGWMFVKINQNIVTYSQHGGVGMIT